MKKEAVDVALMASFGKRGGYKMKLNEKQFEKALQTLYIKDSNCVKLPADLYADIMLLTNSCGRGKTSYCFAYDGLLADVNAIRQNNLMLPADCLKYEDIKPEEVLVLASRKVVKDQQLNNSNVVEALPTDFCANYFSFDESNRKNKFRTTTAHKFGEWVKQDLIEVAPKVLVIDELHSVESETAFADSLLYTLHFVADHYADMIKFGLTATPQILQTYMTSGRFTYKVVDLDLGAKYKVNQIRAYKNGKIETLLKQYQKKIDQNHKALVYVNSARQAYKLAKEYTGIGLNAAFMISDYNESEVDGKKIADVMKEEGAKDYIIKHSRLPEDKVIVFMNASCREGMNLKDESVKYVFCEAVDMITIEQVLGRMRQNLEEFNVICNYRNYDKLQKNVMDVSKFMKELKDADTPKEKEILMIERYGAQKENKEKQKVVYKYHNLFFLNPYIEGYLKYVEESYIQISNYSNELKCEAISQMRGSRQMKQYDEYLSQLCRYAVSGKVEIRSLWQGVEEASFSNALEGFKAIENDWLNKPLTAQDKKELVSKFDLVNEYRKARSWNTMKNILIEDGYTIIETRKMIDGKRSRVSIIQKEET